MSETAHVVPGLPPEDRTDGQEPQAASDLPAGSIPDRTVGSAFARVVVPAAAYGAVGVAHLVLLGVHASVAADVTQALLMPLLAAVVLEATARPWPQIVRWALLALAFSWCGDVLPDAGGGDTAFLVMVGCFLLAQLAYVRAFWPSRARVRRAVVPVYVAALVALALVCRPGAGALFVPVLVYGVALASTGVLATGLGGLGAVGGAVFFCSDSLIALGHFVDGFGGTGVDVAVMATYVVGQGLLVAGVLRRAGESAAVGADHG